MLGVLEIRFPTRRIFQARELQTLASRILTREKPLGIWVTGTGIKHRLIHKIENINTLLATLSKNKTKQHFAMYFNIDRLLILL